MRKHLLTTALLACAFSASAQQPPVAALTPIPSLNVARYMGVWYEVAKYPNRFQKICVKNTVATYTAEPGGNLSVLNRCTQTDGKNEAVLGEARQLGNATSPKLEVRFAPAWLSFLPFVWGDYWVIDIDADYQLVAVSEPKREFLWVLSRTPEANPKAYDELLARLDKRGFDLKKLERSLQDKASP